MGYIPGMGALPDICARLPGGAQRPRVSAYISGTSALPDIYARLPEGECIYIRQSTRAWDITNMLHFLHFALFNLPSQIKHSLCLYSWGYLWVYILTCSLLKNHSLGIKLGCFML